MNYNLNFGDIETAFKSRSNAELSNMHRLFLLFNNPTLVKLISSLGLWAVHTILPVSWLMKDTIFKHFCGGESLSECTPAIQNLNKNNVGAILDYCVEAKDGEELFDNIKEKIIETIHFTTTHSSHKIVSIKITGFGRFSLLEKIDARQTLTSSEQSEWQRVCDRVIEICNLAAEKNVAIYIDAEESWIQDSIDQLVESLMKKYNSTGKTIVFNTIQLYRHDRLQYLKECHERAKSLGYMLGVKLVRGAYMEKERKRADKMGYESPIHVSKKDTDKDFDAALKYCITNHDTIAICCATHNEQSTLYATTLMHEACLTNDFPGVHFSQLYGMSDHISYILAKQNYSVSKYLPFGPVKEVIPYLIRRAQENSSIAGQMGRELSLIIAEIKRRKKIFDEP